MSDNLPWVQTATGRAVCLIRPHSMMIDFKHDLAPALARQARFSGHVASGPYSVAQHSVEGADALLRETGDKRLAGLFLLHDAHEAYIGDIPTPVKLALETLSRGWDGESGVRVIRNALTLLRFNLDHAIHEAAGLITPNAEETAILKAMDIRMLITERDQLLGPPPKPWGEVYEAAQPIRRNGRLKVLPWPEAADAFMARAERWLPAFSKSRAA